MKAAIVLSFAMVTGGAAMGRLLKKQDIFLDTEAAETLTNIKSLLECVMVCHSRHEECTDTCNAVDYVAETKNCKMYFLEEENIDLGGMMQPRKELWHKLGGVLNPISIPPDYTAISGRYYKYFTAKASYDDAQAQCMSDGGNLAMFKTLNEWNAVKSFWNGTSHWTGLHTTYTAYISNQSLNDVAGAFKWVDGSSVCSNSWMASTAIVTCNQASANCMYMFGGRMNDARCTATYEYICQI